MITNKMKALVDEMKKSLTPQQVQNLEDYKIASDWSILSGLPIDHPDNPVFAIWKSRFKEESPPSRGTSGDEE